MIIGDRVRIRAIEEDDHDGHFREEWEQESGRERANG